MNDTNTQRTEPVARRETQASWVTDRRRWLVAIVAVSLLAASCGSTDSSADSPDSSGSADSAGSADQADETEGASASLDETAGDADEEGDANGDSASEPIEIPASGSTVELTTAMVGGLRVSFDSAHVAVHEGDMIEIRVGDVGNVIVARPTWTGSGETIDSVDRFVELATTLGGYEVAPTGETSTVLGQELIGYRFAGEVAPGQALFPSSILGLGSNAGWSPGPVGELFLGELGTGVLAVGITASDDASVAALRPLLGDVTATLEFTAEEVLVVGDGQVGAITSVGDPIIIEPRTDIDLDVLASPFAPVEPGTYDLPNLSSPSIITVGDGWLVAPNFPGFVVLADLTMGRGGGPGDHDVAFLSGASGLHSLDPVRSDAIPPAPISTAEDFAAMLSDPPAGLIVSSLELEAELGGQPAIEFSLQVDPTVDCTAAQPCNFMFAPANPDFVIFVKSGYATRFWFIPDVADGLLVAAQAPSANADWIDGRALELIETITFG